MKVAYFPKVLSKEPTSLILGSFESFHNGHFELLKASRKSGFPTSIMLIENPEDLPNHSQTLFYNFNERLRNVANLKVEYATIVKYNSQIALTDGKDFLKKIIEVTNAKEIIVGKDFAMGKNRNLLARDIKKHFSNVQIIDFFKIKQVKLSTTILKELVSVGDFATINNLCPSPYFKILSINNQNFLTWTKTVIPQSGVYACFTIFENMKYFSYLHISQKKIGKLFTPELAFKNKSQEIILEFHKQIRVIRAQKEDQVVEEDIEKCKAFLKDK